MSIFARLTEKKAKAEKLLIALSDYHTELKKDLEKGMDTDTSVAKAKEELEVLEKQNKEALRILNETKKKNEDTSKVFEEWKDAQTKNIESLKTAAEADRVEAGKVLKEVTKVKETLERDREEFDKKRRDLENRHAKIAELAREKN